MNVLVVHVMKLIVFSFLTVACLSKGERAKGTGKPNQKTQSRNEGTIFLQDLELGSVVDGSVHSITFQNDVLGALQQILKTYTRATGQEHFQVAKTKPVVDDRGGKHVRFEQMLDGLPVAGAAIVMHIDSNGKIFALNGEFVPAGSINSEVIVGCDDAFRDITSDPFYSETTGLVESTWLTACEPMIVVDSGGVGHKAWQRMLGYKLVNGPYQKDVIFVSVKTGHIVAVHPKVFGALAIETYGCPADNTGNFSQPSIPTAPAPSSGPAIGGTDDNFYDDFFGDDYYKPEECVLISDSTSPINTGDSPVDGAHNSAIATYNFYYNQYGRDSLDNNGLKIISYAHYYKLYNNAFWDGTAAYYGDGDGFSFGPFSNSIEVVAHELTHGVTQFSSNLVYYDQSGALNEAMSDIFGAVVSRQEGQSIDNVWLIAEDAYTPYTAGDALRNMADPAQYGNSDFYLFRYQGFFDNGGVHSNSGIANLAFKLLVTGGTHPRYPSINVPAIDPDFDTSMLAAARIFYMANVACLTPNAGFFAALQCTKLHAGEFEGNVEQAWAAVGVSTTGIPISDGVSLPNQALETGLTKTFTLDVPAFKRVVCTTSGPNGDLDMFADFISLTGYDESCVSETFFSDEYCTVGPAQSEGKLVVTLYAYKSFSGATLVCTIEEPVVTELVDYVWTPFQSGGVTNFVLASVIPGSTVTCVVQGYSISMQIKLESTTGSSSCGSLATFGYENSCSAGPLCSVGNATVRLESSGTDEFAQILCKMDVPTVFTNEISLQNQRAKAGALTTYVIENVAFHAQVACTVQAAVSLPSLYMYLPTSSDYGLSCQEYFYCQVGPAEIPTKTYVSLYTFEGYNALNIICTSFGGQESNSTAFPSLSPHLCTSSPSKSPSTAKPVASCAQEGEPCALNSDCCKAKKFKCGKKGKCVSCKKKSAKCKKNKDCCSDECLQSGNIKKCS